MVLYGLQSYQYPRKMQQAAAQPSVPSKIQVVEKSAWQWLCDLIKSLFCCCRADTALKDREIEVIQKPNEPAAKIEQGARAQSHPFRGGLAELSDKGDAKQSLFACGESPSFQEGVLQDPIVEPEQIAQPPAPTETYDTANRILQVHQMNKYWKPQNAEYGFYLDGNVLKVHGKAQIGNLGYEIYRNVNCVIEESEDGSYLVWKYLDQRYSCPLPKSGPFQLRVNLIELRVHDRYSIEFSDPPPGPRP